MAILVMGIGVPGAGKSTILKSLASETHMAYIAEDEICAVLSRTSSPTEGELQRAVNKKIADAFNDGKDVIYDSTNCSTPRRKRVLESLRGIPLHIDVVACQISVELETALSRNLERYPHKRTSETSILGYWKILENDPPTFREGFSNIVIVNAQGHLTVESERDEIVRELADMRGR